MASAKAPAASAVPPNESSNTTVRTAPLPSCSVKLLMALPSSIPDTTRRLPCSSSSAAAAGALTAPARHANDRTQPERDVGFTATFAMSELAWNTEPCGGLRSYSLRSGQAYRQLFFQNIWGYAQGMP